MAWPTRLRRQSPGEVYTSMPINPFLQRGRRVVVAAVLCHVCQASSFFFWSFFSLPHLFFVLFASCGGQKGWVGRGAWGGGGGGGGGGEGGRFCGNSSIHCVFCFFLAV